MASRTGKIGALAVTFALGVLVVCAGGAEAGTLLGSVVSKTTGVPLEGAVVKVFEGDSQTAVRQVYTNSMGMYAADGLGDGELRIEASAAGYQTESAVQTMAGQLIQLFSLSPEGGVTLFDLQIQVTDIHSTAVLPGAQITAMRFGGPNQTGEPDAQKVVSTDALGNASFEGMTSGYYQFQITKVGFEPLTHPASGKVYLAQGHTGVVALKPVAQSVTVTVTGWDPVTQSVGPLRNTLIEVVGTDFDMIPTVPLRSYFTDEQGQVVVQDLGATPWVVTAKKFGYTPVDATLMPDAAGDLPDQQLVLEIHQSTGIQVELDSVYAWKTPLEWAEVYIDGVPGTPTEGIHRELEIVWAEFADSKAKAKATKLLPGAYRIRVSLDAEMGVQSGLGSSNGSVYKSGSGRFHVTTLPVETEVEVVDEDLATATMWLPAVNAHVRGRVLAVNALDPLLAQPFPVPKPNVRVQFISTDGQYFDILKPEFAIYETITDEHGYYELEVPAGQYGLVLPDEQDYFGHHIEYTWQHPTPALSPLTPALVTQGWPYPEAYPAGYQHPSLLSPWLPLDSDGTYNLDLVIHKQTYLLNGWLGLDDIVWDTIALLMDMATLAIQQLYPLTELATEPALFTLTDGQTTRTSGLNRPDYAWGFTIDQVPPGQYTLCAEHAHYAFTNNDTSNNCIPIDLRSFPPPGELPAQPITESMAVPGEAFPLRTTSGSNDTFVVTHKQDPTQGSVTIWQWNEVSDQYADVTCSSQLGLFMQFQDLPGYAFKALSGSGCGGFKAAVDRGYTLFVGVGPGTGDTQWAKFQSNPTHQYAVYSGGPSSNVGPASYPTGAAGSALVHLKTVLRDGTSMEGLQVTRSETNLNQPLTSGQVQASSWIPGYGSHVTNPQWAVADSQTRLVQLSPLEVEVTLELERQMVVSGQVQYQDGTPAPAIPLKVASRFGKEILFPQPTTDASGHFQFALPQQVLVIEAAVPGYLPVRTRFAANTPDGLDIQDAKLTLKPVPPPQFQSLTIDRFGLFLPGITRSGDSAGFNSQDAVPRLTATWTATLTPATLQYTLDGFDTLENSNPQPIVIEEGDPVTAVYLLDQRMFVRLADGSYQPQALQLPSPTLPQVQAFLKSIQLGQTSPESASSVVALQGERLDPTHFQGKFGLWSLPPGEFTPIAIAVTRLGGVQLVTYSVPAGRKPLLGAYLPAPVATIVNLVGSVANGTWAPSAHKNHPRGSFTLVPDVQALIDENDGYISYDYRAGMVFGEGTQTPANGVLALGSRWLGLLVNGQLQFKVKGSPQTIETLGQLAVTKDFLLSKGLQAPAIATGSDGKPPVPGLFAVTKSDLTGQGSIGGITTYTAGGFPNLELKTAVQATYDFTVEFNINQALSKVGHIGAFLATVDKTKAFQLRATSEMRVGGKVESTWRMNQPQASEFMSLYPPVSSLMGTFQKSDVWQLIWRAAMGLRASALKGRGEVYGKIQVGQPANTLDPGVKFTFTQDFKWPVIKRVEGAASVVAGVKFTLAGVTLNKSFQWDLIRVDWQLQTEPYMDLVPTNETTKVVSPLNAPPSVWTGKEGTLVTGLFPGGEVAASDQSGAMVYTQTDPATGLTTLMVSLPSGEALAGPIPVVTEGGIVSVALARVEEKWLLVYSAIDWKDLGNPDANTRLMYLLGSEDGSQWTQPALLEAQNSAAYGLTLAASGSQALLAYVYSKDGIGASTGDVRATLFANNQFGPIKTLFSQMNLRDLSAAAGPDTEVAVAVATASGEAKVVFGPQWGNPETAAFGGIKNVDLAFDSQGSLVAFVAREDGNNQVQVRNESWVTLAELPDTVGSAHVAASWLTGAQGDVLLLAFSQAGQTDLVRYAMLDGQGAVLQGPETVALTGSGWVEKIEILGLEDATSPYSAAVLVRMSDGASSQLKEFLVALDAPPALPPDSPDAPLFPDSDNPETENPETGNPDSDTPDSDNPEADKPDGGVIEGTETGESDSGPMPEDQMGSDLNGDTGGEGAKKGGGGCSSGGTEESGGWMWGVVGMMIVGGWRWRRRRGR